MNIPKFWAHSIARPQGSPGRPAALLCWKWSDVSLADAQHLADARAIELARMLQSGEPLDRYAYGDRPLREEIVDSIADDSGSTVAVVTRNLYGALVLNTANVMFIDIDFSERQASSGAAGLLRKLFGRTTKPPDEEQQRLEQVRNWAARESRLGMRVYRTRAGLRCLITNLIFEPASAAAIELLRGAGSDPLYVRLCQAQSCFRARLTPKPWRCGQRLPPTRFPWTSSEHESRFRAWQGGYERSIASYSVCRFLQQIGSTDLHPQARAIVAFHDRFTCGGPDRSLA